MKSHLPFLVTFYSWQENDQIQGSEAITCYHISHSFVTGEESLLEN